MVTKHINPGQPNQLWSFGNAISLLNNAFDQSITDSLNEYLLLHRSLIVSPDPFESKSEPVNVTTEIMVNGILYTDLTPQNISDSEKLSKLLSVDQKQCLRIISQISKRFPVKFPQESGTKKANFDEKESQESDNTMLYASKILKERRTILECSLELLSRKLDDSSSSTVQNLGRDLFLNVDYFDGILECLARQIDSLSAGTDTRSNDLIYKETLLTISTYLKILVELSLNNSLPSSSTIKWFKFMRTFDFSLNLNRVIKDSESEYLYLVNSLSTIISISLLSLDKEYGDTSFFYNAKCFKELNDLLSGSNSNAVIMYAWSITLLRKYYLLEENDTNGFTDVITMAEIDSSINTLSLKCAKLNVFHEIQLINDILKFDNLYSSILYTLISAAMPLITLNADIASTIAYVLKSCPDFIVQKFFDDPATTNALIVSRAKFPLQLSPFIKLTSINGSFALNEFKELRSYMKQYPVNEFQSYVIDDENTELVKLTNSIDIYPPYEISKKLSLLLEPNTKAKILPGDNESSVSVAFLYNYNGIAFLGRVLQNLSIGFDPLDSEKVDLTVNIFELLTLILKDTSKEDGQYVLDTMSIYMDGSDIVEAILRLLDQSLHSRTVKLFKTVCDLLYYLNPLASDRIWSYLSNSILLSDGGKEGFVTTIFTSIEMVNGDFSFTLAFINLTEALAHASLQLKAKHSVAMKGKVLAKCINHLIFVFESFVHCRFNHSFQKLEMGSLILDTFSNIVSMVYGLRNSSSDGKISEVFIESAKSIVDCFLIDSSNFSRTCYPITMLIDSLETDLIEFELNDSTSSLYQSWISSVLTFTELIVSIRTSINYPPSTLESTLFNKVPILVKAYALYEPSRKDILNLLTALSNGNWPHETRPSFLSHLGKHCTQILLDSMIADLENEFDSYNVKVAIYEFISAVMSGDQEGLCVLLLGVRDIVNNLKDNGGKKSPSNDNSLVKTLKKNIKNIEFLPDPVALHLVDSMVLVINNWSSINSGSSNDLVDDSEFIDQLINKVNSTLSNSPKSVDGYIEVCYKQKLISKIFEVLALYLFSTKNDKIQSRISTFLVSKDFKHALNSYFTINSYHSNLHNDLETEFEVNLDNFKIQDFRCALTKRNRFGINTVYNLSVLDGMFSSHQQWPQLREKVIASAVEMQYLSVQIDVAKSLGALLTALCRKDPSVLNNDIIEFCTHILKTNINEGLPAEFFSEIFHTRIQICFFIIYTIHNSTKFKKDSALTFELLKTSADLLSSDSMGFIKELTESTGTYRPLLRIIYCSLSMIQEETSLLVEHFSIVRDLFDLVVNKGTKTLLIEVQNDVYLSRTNKNHVSTKTKDRIEDILLILSILKLFVEIKISSNNQFELATVARENDLIRSILNLYSFSHLIVIEGDYIFAQLGLMFIQELMKIDVTAQDLIDGGLFTVLQVSAISNTIKNGDVSIISSPQFHRIWTNGILPIILFSLSNIGPNVLPDVCFALTTFKKQVESCIDSWAKDSSTIRITSATINETSQLLLIFHLLKKYNVEGFLGINTTAPNSNTVDVPVLPGLDSPAKREDFVDNINNLLKHPKFLTSRISPSSIEELRIIEADGKIFDSFVKGLIEEIGLLVDYV